MSLSLMSAWNVLSFPQLGINEISEAVYTAVEHSDSEDSEKSDTSDSEYSDEDQKSKNEQEDGEDKEGARSDKESLSLKKKPKPPAQNEDKEELKSTSPEVEKTEELVKDKAVSDSEKEFSEKGKNLQHPAKEKLKGKDETDSPTVHLGLDSDSESELVIDLGDDHCAREGRKNKKESKEPSKQDGRMKLFPFFPLCSVGLLPKIELLPLFCIKIKMSVLKQFLGMIVHPL